MLNQTPEQREAARLRRAEQLRAWREDQNEWVLTGAPEIAATSPKPDNRSKKPRFDLNVMLLDAAAAGEVNDVRELLRAGANPDAQDILGVSVLHRAAMINNGELIELLLNNGANIEILDVDLWTPLFTAVHFGSNLAVQILLKRGANVLAADRSNRLVVDICEFSDIRRVLKEYMEANNISANLLQEARLRESEALLKEIARCVKEGRPLTSIEVSGGELGEGATVLHIAASKGYINVARAALRAGMDINCRDSQGWTPVHAAVYWDQLDMLKYLAHKGAQLELLTVDEEQPVDLAIDESVANVVRDLIKKRSSGKKGELVRGSSQEGSGSFFSDASSLPPSPAVSRTRLKPSEMQHIDAVQERASLEFAGNVPFLKSEDRQGTPSRLSPMQIEDGKGGNSGSRKRSSRAIALWIVGALAVLAALLVIAGGVVVGVTGVCLPGGDCALPVTPMPGECAAATDCRACAALPVCVWCAEVEGGSGGGGACVGGNALTGPTDASVCIDDGSAGHACGPCKQYFHAQCMVANMVIYNVLLGIAAAIGALVLIILVVLLVVFGLCASRFRLQRIDSEKQLEKCRSDDTLIPEGGVKAVVAPPDVLVVDDGRPQEIVARNGDDYEDEAKAKEDERPSEDVDDPATTNNHSNSGTDRDIEDHQGASDDENKS